MFQGRIICNSHSDVKWILKRRLFSLLFAFLALVTLVQQPLCACSDTKLQPAAIERTRCQMATGQVKSEGSCCCQIPQAQKVWTAATQSVHPLKPCCGMVDRGSLALANTLRISSNTSPPLVRLTSFNFVAELHSTTFVARINRAPPYLRGLGSSETYLFKQSLLL